LHLNRFDAQADIELGLHAEAVGNTEKAERFLLQAFAIDNSYVPRWSLAGFYLRRGNLDAFWIWAHKAVEMPSEKMDSLFELCSHVSANPDEITAKLLSDNPEPIQPVVIRQFLKFMLRKGQMTGAEAVAQRLIQIGAPSRDRSVLFAIVNQMLTVKNAAGAAMLWHALIKQRWVDGPDTVPYNANFNQDPLPVGFDWLLPSYAGLHSWPERSGLETEFTGGEPEECSIVEQTMVLAPGNYTMEYTYRTTTIPRDTGIQWQIVDLSSKSVLAGSPYLSSETEKSSNVSFIVVEGAPLLHLRLIYKRVLGTPRVAGSMIITSIHLQNRPNA